VRADQHNPQPIAAVPKSRAQRETDSTREKITPQLAKAETAVLMWMAKRAANVKQRAKSVAALVFWQCEKLLLCGGADNE